MENLLENANELDVSEYKNNLKIGISSGASVPEILVREVIDKFEKSFDVALFEFNSEMICLLLWRVSTFALVISGSTNLLNSFPFSTVVLITSCSIRDAARFLIIAILCDDVLLNLLLSFLCLILTLVANS